MLAKYGLPETVRWCVRCVMSNQRPSSEVEHTHTAQTKKRTLHIDEDGVCDACRVAEQKQAINWPERERELTDLLAQYRRKDGSHDCIVPGSGGKDSYLAAHLLKHRYGMNPLMVTWAPQCPTDVGIRNLRRWQAIADHVMYTPNIEVHRLLTRLAVDNLFHIFQPFVLGQKNLAPKMSILHDIPLCFFGEAEAEYGNPIAEAMTPHRASEYHSDNGNIHLAGVAIKELRERYKLSTADLSAYLPAKPEQLLSKKIDIRYLGYYVRWKPQEAYYYAVEHGGFETSPERTPGTYSKYNSLDCKADDFHYWQTWIKFGIGRATYDAAQEIRSGDITREEGVALVRRFDGEWPARFAEELFAYLSVPGFPRMDKERFLALAEQFKSPHLWDGDKLRHVVA
jgi:N-acetyl sugar amidotransferase